MSRRCEEAFPPEWLDPPVVTLLITLSQKGAPLQPQEFRAARQASLHFTVDAETG
jgi:hypothetical protein